MGFWSNLKNKFKHVAHVIGHAISTSVHVVGHKVSQVGHTIGSFFHKTGQKIGAVVSSTTHTVSNAISTVYTDGKNALSTVYGNAVKIENKVIDDVNNTAGTLINKTTGILSGPLMLVGGGVALFLLFSGRNSGVNATISK